MPDTNSSGRGGMAVEAETAMRQAAISRKLRLWNGGAPVAPKPEPRRPLSPFMRERLQREAERRHEAQCPINFISEPSWRFIFRLVSLRYDISVKAMLGNSRQIDISTARHIAVHLLYTHTGLSMPQIGKLLGRDHTTILNSIRIVTGNVRDRRRPKADRFAPEARPC